MPTVTFTRTNVRSKQGYVTIDVAVNYSESYNINTNQTTLTITSVQIRNRNYTIGSVIIKGSVKINGSTVASFSPGESAGGHVNLTTSYTSISGGTYSTAVVSHNADGSGSFTLTLDEAVNVTPYYSGFFGYHDTSYKVGIATPSNQSVALTTRPRISSVSATNAYIGEPVTITLSRYNSSFTHTVKVSCAGNTETLMTKGSTYPTLTWTPALATYAPRITNSMAATATITCETYNGSTLIGSSTATCTLTLKAADVAPSVSIATADPTGNLATYGKYVKGKSKITVTLTPAFAYGATLATQSISANGASYNTSPATTDFILSASNTGITASIKDSRGQTATASATIQIYDYDTPKINAFSAHRCNADGTENNAGAYMAVGYSVELSPLGNQNAKTLTVKYKKLSASTWSTATITLSTYSETGVSQPIAVDTNSTYNVQLVLEDDFSTGQSAAVAEIVLPTASTRMNWGAGENGGIAIGKVNEYDKTLEIADDWAVKSKGIINLIYPVGSIYMSVNSASPASLFGGTWTQIEDTFLLAAGQTYTAGDTGGEATHTLSKDEMPSHTHRMYGASDSGMPDYFGGSSANYGITARTGSSYDRLEYVGGGQAHNNMPPYLAVYVWKRTA